MEPPGLPTLDQLRVLAAVVDTGSFSAAARCLQRTQSAVSYAVGALEAELGLALFERGRRRPVLTEVGRGVLADARRIAILVDELCARTMAMRGGIEAEVSVAIDVMFPSIALVAALEAFTAAYPTVTLRLHVEALGGVPQLVLERAASIGVSGWMPSWPDMLERRQAGSIALIPVAAPSHPLAQLLEPVPTSMLREHTQLVLADRTQLTEGKDFGVTAVRTWRLGDLGAKHALLRAGLGWGNMPEPMVRDDLSAGRLVRLVRADGANHQLFPFTLIHRRDAHPGPAARWLADRLQASEFEALDQ